MNKISLPQTGAHQKFKTQTNIHTSIIFFRTVRKRILKASVFFFSRLCPFCAPFSLAFISVMALKNN